MRWREEERCCRGQDLGEAEAEEERECGSGRAVGVAGGLVLGAVACADSHLDGAACLCAQRRGTLLRIMASPARDPSTGLSRGGSVAGLPYTSLRAGWAGRKGKEMSCVVVCGRTSEADNIFPFR